MKSMAKVFMVLARRGYFNARDGDGAYIIVIPILAPCPLTMAPMFPALPVMSI